MNKFKDLKVWHKSVEFAVKVYDSTNAFPQEERYGLVSQIIRSAVSIASNIAEGCGRNSDKDFSRFLSIANGSAYEIETQLIIANKLGFIQKNRFDILISELEEIQKMIYALDKSLTLRIKNFLLSFL